MDIFSLFTMLGGLALFLFGMDILGKSLEKQAGSRLSNVLSRLTDNPLKGFFLGAAVTAVIQSSSAATVMVVGFVNSGLMTLHGAVGVIMGSNVGTTITSWVLSLSGLEGSSLLVRLLKPSGFAPLLSFIGVLLYLFSKREKRRGIGTILLGFSILMMGMETMSNAVKPLADLPEFTSLFTMFENPLLGILLGVLVTAAIQSSSASVGILQALATTGAVTVGSAVPIILGQNIGTCVTALLSSVGANKNARRAAMVHLYFNIVGVTLFALFFYGLDAAIHFPFVSQAVTPLGIAQIHTIFNLAATAALLPCGKLLERLAVATIPDDKTPEKIQLLDERLLAQPTLAVKQAKNVTDKMATLCRESILKSMSLTHRWDDAIAMQVQEAEEEVDRMEDSLGTYLVAVSEKELSQEDNRTVSILLHTIGDFERIGDHAVNLHKAAKEMHDKKISFSQAAQKELAVLEHAVQDLLNRAIEAFEGLQAGQASRAEPLEEVVDELVRELKNRHIARLQTGACTIELGFVLQDILTNYERVADHCSNIAVAVLELTHGSFETHAYLNRVRDERDSAFTAQYEKDHRHYGLEGI